MDECLSGMRYLIYNRILKSHATSLDMRTESGTWTCTLVCVCVCVCMCVCMYVCVYVCVCVCEVDIPGTRSCSFQWNEATAGLSPGLGSYKQSSSGPPQATWGRRRQLLVSLYGTHSPVSVSGQQNTTSMYIHTYITTSCTYNRSNHVV